MSRTSLIDSANVTKKLEAIIETHGGQLDDART